MFELCTKLPDNGDLHNCCVLSMNTRENMKKDLTNLWLSERYAGKQKMPRAEAGCPRSYIQAR